jgi:hypothetical protein
MFAYYTFKGKLFTFVCYVFFFYVYLAEIIKLWVQDDGIYALGTVTIVENDEVVQDEELHGEKEVGHSLEHR